MFRTFWKIWARQRCVSAARAALRLVTGRAVRVCGNATQRAPAAIFRVMDYLVKNLNYLYSRHGEPEPQLAAARAAGVGQPALSKILDGRTKVPGYNTVVGLARHFGVSVEDLVARDLEAASTDRESQPARFDDDTMSQAVELLYLLADLRPEDPRFRRLTWPKIQMAAEGIRRRQAGVEMKAVIVELLAGIE